MHAFLQDLRFGLRMLWKSPGLTAAAVVSLGLGVGANSTIYSVIHGVIMRAGIFKQPDRLVAVWESNPKRGVPQTDAAISSALEWRRQNHVFEGIEMCTGGGHRAVTGPGLPERVQAQNVTPGLFGLLGVRPELGLAFTLPQDRRAVVLSHNYWERRFASNRAALGRTLDIDGEPHTIIGVMPPRFQRFFTDGDADIWLPIDFSASPWTDRSERLITLARLKPEITLAHAQAQMDIIARRLEQAWPETHAGWMALVEPLPEAMTSIWKPVLYPLFGAVIFVLLIACVNISNLLLARAAARQKEMAVRAALGAGRFRLIRQLLVEGVVLAIPGGLLGVLLAYWGIQLWLAGSPPWFPAANEITIDRTILFFTLTTGVASGLALGLLPALQASKPDTTQALKQGGRSGGSSSRRARNILVVSEVALAMVLLIGAGLMVRTFSNLNPAERGFRTNHILTMQLELAGPGYAHDRQVQAFFDQVLESAKAIPGVDRAALATALPDGGSGSEFSIAGSQPIQSDGRPPALLTSVSAGYFQVFGIALRRGRPIAATDGANSAWVVVINETFARRYFPNEDPIGRFLITRGSSGGKVRQVVGVVEDILRFGSVAPEPRMYIALSQQPTPALAPRNSLDVAIAVHTTVPPKSVEPSMRKTLAALDPTHPPYAVATMDERLRDASVAREFGVWLFSAFAALALALALIGIHGVVSWTANDRVQEIGVRMALGAGRLQVLRLILWDGFKFALAGVAAGLAASFALCRLMYDFLVGVKPTDPATYAVVAIILVVVSLLSIARPALRATRVDPAAALRSE